MCFFPLSKCCFQFQNWMIIESFIKPLRQTGVYIQLLNDLFISYKKMDPFSTFSVFITFEKIIIQQMPKIIVNMNVTVMYMDISIKSVEFISFILSCYKFCLFAHLADLDLLPGACQLFHLARNVFVPNGERLHLFFPLSRWFIMSCYFSSETVC